MARRRRHQEEHENHERWLVSYADFITLLFAFFVVMYSISSVNEGKYRVLSETLNSVFRSSPTSDKPIQVGERPRDMLPSPQDAPLTPKRSAAQADTNSGDAQGQPDADARFKVDPQKVRVADEIAISLQDYVDQGLLKIEHVGDSIEIDMKEKMLFSSGEARLSRSALRALREIAKTLTRVDSYLQIEGHTDDVPIATAAFPSNWELSAARAASVVHFLARTGVAPQRMSAVGRGEFEPIAENTSDQGRAANRRVKIVVLTDKVYQDPSREEAVPWAEAPSAE